MTILLFSIAAVFIIIIGSIVNISATFLRPPKTFSSPYFKDEIVFDAYKENLLDFNLDHFLAVVTGEPNGVTPLFWKGHILYYKNQDGVFIGYNADTKQKIVVSSQIQVPVNVEGKTTVSVIDQNGNTFVESGSGSEIDLQTLNHHILLGANMCVRDKPLVSEDGKYVALNVLASESDKGCQGWTTNLHVMQIASP